MTSKTLFQEALHKSLSYEEYRKLVDNLFEQGQTTGPNQSEKMVHYTGLNIQRMQKWEKRYAPAPGSLEAMTSVRDEIWLILTEGWCGDAAHSLPVIHKLTQVNKSIDLRLVLRDENLELMDTHLTDGGRSIPKLIRLRKETLEEIGEWGPRPEPAQNMFKEMRAAGVPHDEYTKALQLWYARDRGKTIEMEIAKMVAEAKV
ncbi:MAG: thioredoxin family protein [Owenweeksia sp.]|nr:thioredoxin family protein [Owenweeksia sp.]MBG00476.1 thioredoxin family protein [Owenweeksia sp.]HBF19541.1 thioredoxin family protein [Cryomorphaceae bacterium]HCQ14678.1 thioredoxin family protein [Cryomorphaceae bacterium]